MRFVWTGCALLFGLGVATARSGDFVGPTYLPLPEVGSSGQAYPTAGRNPSTVVAINASPYNNTLINQQAAPLPYGNRPMAAGDAMGAGGVNAHDDSVDAWCNGDCGAAFQPCCQPLWFGSIDGLVMGRNHPNKFWTTFESNNNPNQLLNTRDAEARWTGGAEVTVGRWFGGDSCGCGDGGCGLNGVAFTYWGLAPMHGFASIRDPNDQLSTPIDVTNGGITIGGQPAPSFFDNAREHRIWRNDEIHDIELNFLHQRSPSCACQSQVTWLAGIRYFRFQEGVKFGSVAGGFEFGSNGGVNEAYLDTRTTNNMLGFQIGARGDYYFTPRFGVYVAPRIGVFGNNMNSRVLLYRGDGVVSFDIPGQKNDVSFIGQIDFGAEYQFACNWRVFGGYRAIAVTGIALADNQFLPFLADAAGFADIKTNGDLILHGGVAGVEWRF